MTSPGGCPRIGIGQGTPCTARQSATGHTLTKNISSETPANLAILFCHRGKTWVPATRRRHTRGAGGENQSQSPRGVRPQCCSRKRDTAESVGPAIARIDTCVMATGEWLRQAAPCSRSTCWLDCVAPILEGGQTWNLQIRASRFPDFEGGITLG